MVIRERNCQLEVKWYPQCDETIGLALFILMHAKNSLLMYTTVMVQPIQHHSRDQLGSY